MLGFMTMFLSSALWPSLPNISLIGLAFCVFVLILVYRLSAIVTGAILGFMWASICGYYFIYAQLDNNYYQHNVLIQGQVVSLMPLPSSGNTHISSNTKFTFRIEKIGESPLYFAPHARLSWYGTKQPLQQGDRLQLLVTLKPPVGLANPDGFNYQKWLTSKNIVALGYVKASPSNQMLEQKPSMRQRLVNQLQAQKLTQMRWILALSYGDRQLLEPADWELLQRTGTAHLFAISGMHLGIVFICLLATTRSLWRVRTFYGAKTEQFILRPVLLTICCTCCVFYAYLAGNEVPVMRALLTAVMWTVLMIFQRHWRPFPVFLTLLVSFFLLFPYSILGISFWFSFVSVFMLVLYVWRFPLPAQSPWYTKIMFAIKLQLYMSLATLPMIAMTFSALPLSGFAANLLTAPIITFVLVPSCLIASVLSTINLPVDSLYTCINQVFTFVFWILKMLDNALSVRQVFGENTVSVMASGVKWLSQPVVIIILFLITLPHWLGKTKLLLALLGVTIAHTILADDKHLNLQQWQMYVMDVGQGSAIILRHRQQYFLYDTGNAFNGFSMAKTVLQPFFDGKQVKQLSYFVVSHFDNDHAGDMQTIKNNFQIARFLSPVNGCNVADSAANKSATVLPSNDSHYQWGELSITVLWPLSPVAGENNNDSCVLRITDGKHSILFTGDIEKQAELAILDYYRHSAVLKSDVMIAPHHGSKTSSTNEFVRAVAPKHVVFTSGYNNRWGFPDRQVVNRYLAVGANVWVTGEQGRLLFSINPNNVDVSRYRQDEYNRWYFKAR